MIFKKKNILFLIIFFISIFSCTNTEIYDKDITTKSKVLSLTLEKINENLFISKSKIFDISTYVQKIELNYRPNKKYEYIKYQYKGTDIEFFENKNETKKLLFSISGGAFMSELNNSHRGLYEDIVLKTGEEIDILMVDYKVAPRYKYPTANIDIENAWEFAILKGYKEENIVMIGDSAGGNLALSHCLKLRDQGKKLPAAIVLLSPWTDLTNTVASRKKNVKKDIVMGDVSGKNDIPYQLLDNPYVRNENKEDPYISPVFGSFEGFPPTLIHVGGSEMLYDDSYIVYEKMKKEKIDVEFKSFKGMFHVFQTIGDKIKESYDSKIEISKFIKDKL